MSENRPKQTARAAPKSAFKPGQSGNPGGRPKKDERLRMIEDIAREHSEEAMLALLDEAKSGKGAPRVAAAVAILDRGWGKPVERSESGKPGDFVAKSDDEIKAEAADILQQAVKGGFVKVMPNAAKHKTA